jgi:2-aminoadipate transaminase
LPYRFNQFYWTSQKNITKKEKKMYYFSERIKNLQPSIIREIFKSLTDPEIISFAAGNPSPEAFPTEKVAKLSAEIFATEPVRALQYSITEGYPLLREWLKEDGKQSYFNPKRDELVVTHGGQQVMDLTVRCLCNERETVICDNPSFIGSLNTFRAQGAKLTGIPMDEQGIEPEKLDAALTQHPRAAFIYLIPNFQNPTGKTMSLERRKQVLEIAGKHKIMILEDNPYGALRFAGKDIPSLKELDDKGLVIYAGSFSKTLAPGLRVGFMSAPAPIVQKAVVAMQASTVHTNIWAQMLTYKFVTETNFKRHIEKNVLIYKNKCNLMLNALRFGLPQSVTFTEPEGGMFIWCTLPDLPYTNMQAFVKKCLENKVAVVPGNAFSVDENEPSLSFRLNYSTPTDEQILKGTEILCKLAKEMY